MSAIRLARAATGREPLLKFAGAYHGHVDGLLAEAGSGMATAGIPASPGVPAAATAGTVIVPWNDPDAVVAATEARGVRGDPRRALSGEHGPRPAAARLPGAPARARRRQRRAARLRRGHLRLPRRARRRPGASPASCPISRSWARSSAAGCPRPPTAARATLMERIAPAGDVYQAGTLSGNPLAVAAGLGDARDARRRRLRQAGRDDGCAGRRDGGRRGRPARADPVGVRAGHASSSARRPSPTTRVRRRATRSRTARGAGRCWPTACTRRRRSSRPGSRRSRTRRSTWSARSRRRAAAFAAL